MQGFLNAIVYGWTREGFAQLVAFGRTREDEWEVEAGEEENNDDPDDEYTARYSSNL